MPTDIIMTTAKAKPFIKWVGGKSQLIDVIGKQIPHDLLQRKKSIYIEPFIGGGAVLFWILQTCKNIKHAVINDINNDLTDVYRVVRDCPYELIECLEEIEQQYFKSEEDARKDYFLECRSVFNTKSQSKVEHSALFIFLNRTCFNGLYRVNSKGLFNVPFGKYKNPKICDRNTILADSELLQKVEILTGDYHETIKFAGPDAFYYIDPPYRPLSQTSSFTSYDKNPFADKQQIQLREFCDLLSAANAKWILSNSDPKASNADDEFFDTLYQSYQIQRVHAARMINSDATKRGKLTELLIKNF